MDLFFWHVSVFVCFVWEFIGQALCCNRPPVSLASQPGEQSGCEDRWMEPLRFRRDASHGKLPPKALYASVGQCPLFLEVTKIILQACFSRCFSVHPGWLPRQPRFRGLFCSCPAAASASRAFSPSARRNDCSALVLCCGSAAERTFPLSATLADGAYPPDSLFTQFPRSPTPSQRPCARVVILKTSINLYAHPCQKLSRVCKKTIKFPKYLIIPPY